VAASGTSNPLPPPPDEAAFRALIRVGGLIKRVVEPHFARFGISPAQWGILRTLRRAEEAGDEPPRLRDLCNRVLTRPPSVSGVVDRLERLGLVAKVPAPGDLRSRRVRLTDDGRALVRQALAHHAEWIAKVMDGLTLGEQRELSRLLEKFGAHLEHLTAPPGGEAAGSSGRPATGPHRNGQGNTHGSIG
jgi:DNA-binding MarR family transcriptional regulator